MTLETILQILGAGGLGAGIVAGGFMYNLRRAETRGKNADTDISLIRFIEEIRSTKDKEIYDLKESVLELKQLLQLQEVEHKEEKNRLESIIKRMERSVKRLEQEKKSLETIIAKMQNGQ